MLDGYFRLLAEAARREEEAAQARAAVLGSPAPPEIGNPGRLRERWWTWHLKNPHVYSEIEKAALSVAATGATRYSVWPIIGHLRFMETLRTVGDDFKISNDWQALYARLFLFLHPEHSDLFATKEMKR